jgi:hypothetical protein
MTKHVTLTLELRDESDADPDKPGMLSEEAHVELVDAVADLGYSVVDGPDVVDA